MQCQSLNPNIWNSLHEPKYIDVRERLYFICPNNKIIFNDHLLLHSFSYSVIHTIHFYPLSHIILCYGSRPGQTNYQAHKCKEESGITNFGYAVLWLLCIRFFCWVVNLIAELYFRKLLEYSTLLYIGKGEIDFIMLVVQYWGVYTLWELLSQSKNSGEDTTLYYIIQGNFLWYLLICIFFFLSF